MNLPKINGQKSVFETIKQINQNGQEFWYARDFQNILGYVKWDKFLFVLACINSRQNIRDHFLHMEKMVDIGSGAQRKIDDIVLSRYACSEVRQAIHDLLDRKQQGDELARGPKIPVLSDFIKLELEKLEKEKFAQNLPVCDPEKLNQLFRACLIEIWN